MKKQANGRSLFRLSQESVFANTRNHGPNEQHFFSFFCFLRTCREDFLSYACYKRRTRLSVAVAVASGTEQNKRAHRLHVRRPTRSDCHTKNRFRWSIGAFNIDFPKGTTASEISL